MVKAKLTDGSVLFGLTAENCRRMLAGQPIVFNMSSIGMPPCGIVIIAAEDNVALLKVVEEAGLLTAETKIAGVPSEEG